LRGDVALHLRRQSFRASETIEAQRVLADRHGLADFQIARFKLDFENRTSGEANEEKSEPEMHDVAAVTTAILHRKGKQRAEEVLVGGALAGFGAAIKFAADRAKQKRHQQKRRRGAGAPFA